MRSHVDKQTIFVYQREITLKLNSAKAEKKVGKSLDEFLILVVKVNMLYFRFKMYLTEKTM